MPQEESVLLNVNEAYGSGAQSDKVHFTSRASPVLQQILAEQHIIQQKNSCYFDTARMAGIASCARGLLDPLNHSDVYQAVAIVCCVFQAEIGSLLGGKWYEVVVAVIVETFYKTRKACVF